MIFEPTLVLYQNLEVRSDLAPWVNGIYTVIGIAHDGTISGTEAGNCETTLTLLDTKVDANQSGITPARS
jgi:hypothetical protein